MKEIRYLQVEFDEEIAGYEIPAFRGAIIKKAGEESFLFHNHLSDNKLRYSYPLVQYKTSRNHPVIICLEEAVDEIHKFFKNRDWSIHIGDRQIDMKIANLRVNKFNLQVWNCSFNYRIINWIALNGANYEKFNAIDGLSQKIEFLEKILNANILSFAKGVNWNIKQPVTCKITDYQPPSVITFKKNRLLSFSVQFRTNVFIPNYIGLGKGVSHGFGTILRLKNKS